MQVSQKLTMLELELLYGALKTLKQSAEDMVGESRGLPSPPLQGGACRGYGASKSENKIGLIDMKKALAG